MTTPELIAADSRPPLTSFAPLTWRELGVAGVLCVLAVSLFLAPALLSGRILSPADLLYNYPPWQVQPPSGWTQPGNLLLSDSVLQFEP